MTIAEEYLCRAANEFAKSAQDFYCSAPASPEIWATIASLASPAVALVASVAAFFAWHNSREQLRHQMEDSRKLEIRQATLGLIEALHELSTQSRIAQRDNEVDIKRFSHKSHAFELAAGPELDAIRYRYAIRWIIEASRLRHEVARHEEAKNVDNKSVQDAETVDNKSVQDDSIPPTAHKNFLDSLVFRMTEILLGFDGHKNSANLMDAISAKFGKIYHSHGRNTDPKIIGIYLGGRNIYLGLTRHNLLVPKNPSTKISLEKPY